MPDLGPKDQSGLLWDGSLTLLGRGSVCINTAGEKVYPEEIEEALKTHPVIEDALVVGVPDEDPDSPFRGMVAWPNNPPEQRIVVPAAIEAMASEAKSLGFGELETLLVSTPS